MSLKLVNVGVNLCDYRSQPRSYKEPGYREALAANIMANGQQVPVIGWMANGRFQLVDGGCRLDAIRLAGGTHVLALDLGKEPTEGELAIAQASVDVHKQYLPPVDRARLYETIMAKKGLNGKETAAVVGISSSVLTRYLLLLKLAPDLRELVNTGQLDWSKGSLIAQTTLDHNEQREMAKSAAGMTRDKLAATARNQRSGKAEDAGRK